MTSALAPADRASTIARLRHRLVAGETTPQALVSGIFARIRREGLSPIWISLADERETIDRASRVDLALPLGGVPFAVKDNIDVEGLPTTAGCPSFGYVAARSATVVQRLLDAGAILIGKTNMDQFATGLVGTRSPYGVCSSVFDDRYISGGSSSGSAVAVAQGLCAFSLGTDTAGSGRVPAAFNGLVGLKPTRGILSANGVVPACRSLDCVSIFAPSVADAELVWTVAVGADDGDPFSREVDSSRPDPEWSRGEFRFGVPSGRDLQFFGDAQSALLFERAVVRLEAIGGVQTAIDYEPFREAAALLYAGPWVAERAAAVGPFIEQHTDDVHPIVRDIVLGARAYTAADTWRAIYRLEQLKRDAAREWERMDVLLLPTAGTIYTKAAIDADPVGLNTNLGYYTNFVNLMDLAALAVPAGLGNDGLPFGVSLIGPAFADSALLRLGARLLGEHRVEQPRAAGLVSVAVVGAHLSGQPLNHQLLERHARLISSCRTSPGYRLFALANTTPPKPGLVRDSSYAGAGIEVEVWEMTERAFGSFVSAVPPPLAIGSVQLEDGRWVKGFVCEPIALEDAVEVTAFGGWRAYLSALSSEATARR